MSDRKPHQRHSEALQALDIGALVPPAYARYRPLISEALRFFLANLPAHRLMELLQAQLALPTHSTPLERLLAVIHRSPTLHKLGQILARDPKLATSLRTALQQLESLPPTTPMSALRPVIESELGDRPDIELDGPALAEASVAVVVPCRWREPEAGRQIRAVLKVLKPGIGTRLREELDVLPGLGNWLETRCAELNLPPVQYRETLASVRGLLLNEVELRNEQAHLTAAALHYASLPQVKIPKLLPFSTARITAMERIDGCKVTDADHLSEVARHRLAATTIEALLARPFWSDDPLATFHADPHAGNLFVTEDGRLALLDWSLVTLLDKSQREALVDLGLGALTLDEWRVRQAIVRLAPSNLQPSALHNAVAQAIRQVRRRHFSWLVMAYGPAGSLGDKRRCGLSRELDLVPQITVHPYTRAQRSSPGLLDGWRLGPKRPYPAWTGGCSAHFRPPPIARIWNARLEPRPFQSLGRRALGRDPLLDGSLGGRRHPQQIELMNASGRVEAGARSASAPLRPAPVSGEDHAKHHAKPEATEPGVDEIGSIDIAHPSSNRKPNLPPLLDSKMLATRGVSWENI